MNIEKCHVDTSGNINIEDESEGENLSIIHTKLFKKYSLYIVYFIFTTVTKVHVSL